jgi:AcrR family transcriptional regulator
LAKSVRRTRARKPVGRREAAAARTREEILDAAARALARRGFKSVSLQDIAREVGFTAPALYVYFESKEAIFAALAKRMADELHATFDPPPAAGDSFQVRVETLLRRQLEWVDHRRDAFSALFALQMAGQPIEQPPGGGPLDYLDRLAGWLRKAVRSPRDLGDHTAADAAALLMGVGHGFFLRWLVSRDGSRLADQTERLVGFFFHGLVGPPRRPRSR